MAKKPRSREFVQSLARGLSVIRAFDAERSVMTLSEVAKRVGITRAAARRFLLTLQELGYVENRNERYFALRPRLLDLGYAYLSTIPWWREAQPVMEEASAVLHEACSASVLDGTDIVYVARVPAKRIMTINLSIGTRVPAFVASMGRILLAHLSPQALDQFFQKAKIVRFTEHTLTDETKLRAVLARVGQQGYSVVDQELEIGLRSIAVPIFDRRGEVIAALNSSAHAARVSKNDMSRIFLPVLRDASRRITETMRR